MNDLTNFYDEQYSTEISHGMRIDWDVPIEMDDGIVLRADIYRPEDDGNYPVILSYGPYAKWLHWKDGYPHQWKLMEEDYPSALVGSSSRYQNWELVDPEIWVPDGYICMRVDSRGAGRSPGFLEVWSPREAQDFHDCIEWAGAQSWSNGKVGLNGISYYGMNQWQVASLQPKCLSAICVWEGAADFYRDMAHHGGIACRFPSVWYNSAVVPRQNGKGANGYKSRLNGEWISGPQTLTEEELGESRSDFGQDILDHPLIDEYWLERMPDYSKIDVPIFSSGNWGGVGLHPRGNTEGYLNSASKQKWLEIHGLEHFTHFYTEYGIDLQKRFFGYFLKGEDNGWDKQPSVQLLVRHPGEVFVKRSEEAWPIPRTNWTELYLDTAGKMLVDKLKTESEDITYQALGDGITFLAPPVEKETEITGPVSAKLFISSETKDADIFLVLRVFTPDMKEIVFKGANDPHTPVGLGWLRASHRKLDEKMSLPYRPYHTHDEVQFLIPNEIYELDIEIWPTSIVLPEGYRLGLSVRGRDYVWPGYEEGMPEIAGRIMYGVGPFKHEIKGNRPLETYDGKVTLYSGPEHPSNILLPIIPEK